MNIAIIGTGYVGLPSGVGFAEKGHTVTCIDRDTNKIDLLKSGIVTLYEEGLEELLKKNIKRGTIRFLSNMEEGIKGADVVIIAVGTPPHPVTNEADMQYVHAAAIELAQKLSGYTVIATKSTVPVGTGDVLEKLISKTNPKADFDVISLPEFLREGYAVHDFFHPDRVIVGSNSERAKDIIKQMYLPFGESLKILYVSRRSSEIIKYASNSFLAIKIHYINEISDFCKKTGADIMEVAKGIGMDSRIGDKFLIPGPGFGGSCFPKDTLAMSYMAHQNDMKISLIDTTIEGNKKRKEDIAQEIFDKLSCIQGNRIKLAVLGLAFKSGTDDCRESPSIDIIKRVLKKNNDKQVDICVYDPKAINNAKAILSNTVNYAESLENCVKEANCIAILTEWPEFKKIKQLKILDNCKILDYRNIL